MTNHNFLLIKKKGKLKDYEKLLYDAYSSKVKNILLIASKLVKKEFDPVKILFWGLDSISNEESYKKRYRSILEITEYFHAAKGQRGKFLEKILASKSKKGICSIRLSEIPIWFESPYLLAKRKVLGNEKLSPKEKKKLRLLSNKWKFLGSDDENIDFDVGNIKQDSLILFEQKSRVDSGGTSARREIFSAKVLPLLKRIKSDKKLFEISDTNEELSFEDLIKKLNIRKVAIFDGILFNKDGSSATVEGDNLNGFYSSRKSEFRETLRFLEDNQEFFKILDKNEEDLSINIKVKDSNIEIEMGVAYGDDIPKKLLNLNFSLQDTIISGFDDLWLAFKIGIDEREIMEKEEENNIIKLKKFSETNKEFKELCEKFRREEGKTEVLDEMVGMINKEKIIKINKEEYLEDLLFLLIGTRII